MVWLKNRFIKDGAVLTGVIATVSATYIHKLSNFPPSPLIRFSDVSLTKSPHYLRFLVPDKTLPLTEDIEHVAGNLYVTNKERTICDMILYESADEFIYESLETYLDLYGTIETLKDYSKKYNCEEKMFYYIDSLDEYLADSY